MWVNCLSLAGKRQGVDGDDLGFPLIFDVSSTKIPIVLLALGEAMKRYCFFIAILAVFLITALFSCLEDDGSFKGDDLDAQSRHQEHLVWAITGYAPVYDSYGLDGL